MNSLTAMRITVGSLAALLTGAVGYGVHAKDEASALRAQSERAASVTPAGQDATAAQQLVVPRDDDWDEADGADGEYGADDDDGGGWRIVVPDQSGGAVQPAPAQPPHSQAS